MTTMRALAFAVGALASCEAPPAARVVDANQEPVVVLALPDAAQARVPVTVTARGSIDLDGALASAVISFGDGVEETLDALDGGAAALEFTHAWETEGLFDVELAVTDDLGLTGRARVRLVVAPPPDSTPPEVEDVTLTSADGAPLIDGARVPLGSAIGIDVRATDADGNLASAEVAAGSQEISIALGGVDARGQGSLLASTGDPAGALTISVAALDLFGNRSSPPVERALLVVGPQTDTDGDGLPDVDDPSPDAFNGLTAEIILLPDGIETDLFGGQRAERVVEALDDAAAPAVVALADASWLLAEASSAPLSSRWPSAPSASTRFAVRFRGTLVAPPGADHVIVEPAGDDIAVVLLGGIAVASADEEFAHDFLRFQRAPAHSEPVGLPADGRIPVDIVVGNGDGEYSWSTRFRFLNGEVTIMNPEAVSQRQFLALPLDP